MKKYNYYDDEPQEQPSGAERGNFTKRIKNALSAVGGAVADIVHGDTVAMLRELPHLRKRVMKIGAAVLAVLAVIIFVAVFSHTINHQNRKNDAFCEDAGRVCTEYIKEYGSIKWETLDEAKYGENQARLTGLCYARQMDFDNDGSDELMLCYNNKNVYYLEVWGYAGKDFVQLYSREANSTEDDTDGAWVAFYHKSNKYYICKSEKDNPHLVTLYALSKDKFKASGKAWDYDFENDIYSQNGEVNASDFETIKLSVFRKSKAEIIVDTVTANIDSFGNISSQAITESKSQSELQAEAYYAEVKKRITRYGAPKIETDDDSGVSYIDGVALVKLLDFDSDGDEELLMVYRKYKSKTKYDSYSGNYISYDMPVYSMDVYDFNGTTARRIFSKESVSNCLDDENSDVFYLMLKNNGKTVDICNNVYTFENSYNYTASSKIYSLSGERFETVFDAKLENEYGYKQYYLDGERVYSNEFDEKSETVPMFLDDDGDVDASKYTVRYFSGRDGESFEEIISETNSTIKKLNPDYTPDTTDDGKE